MIRKARLGLSVAVGLLLAAGVTPASGQDRPDRFQPGAAGVGDPYFPLDGNGGYDVKRYLLDVTYDPATDILEGVATIRARAKQNLSSFNLDLVGLTVESIKVNGRRAAWSRDGGELTVSPRKGLRNKRIFTTMVRYHGVPEPIEDAFGVSGFLHTDDGALIVGEPHVAATWYPVNDHPSDKAAYTFRVTVPAGLEAVANGTLQSRRTKRGWTTWTWKASEPMASYLATATIGEFDLRSYRSAGIRYWDAIDPDLFAPPALPHTGQQFAISQKAQPSYKRLARTITVPAGAATLSFWITRDTEPNWDFVFVEAHTVGEGDWTTLPDLKGHTSEDTGFVCPFWLELHPFLANYQTDNGDGTCSPQGATGGHWWAASGASDGWEQWLVDLSAYAGRDVEVSITYASDDLIQAAGAFVDDIVLSTGAGTTSFEDDGDTFDGWTVPGAPADSAPNPNDWIVGTVADTPAPLGETVEASFSRQPEIIDFLSSMFGPYPFSAAGGIVDDFADLGFALENQTRPIYSKFFFTDPLLGDSVIVHELAHQWFGDSLALARWQHIWLNEGFATYAEWLWSERESLATAQEIFDDLYSIPADDPFWSLTIGDPGPDSLFDFPVYGRGAMTLHQLRLVVGDADFFKILRRWATSRAGGNVTTREFIRLAERVSGEDLDALFDAWLFTAEKPALLEASGLSRSATSQRADHGPAVRSLLRRLDLKRM
jgi:peptidase M1-like protein/immune inhibitor InhA-like protein